MLQNLNIRNIAIADNIEVDWQAGMTSISGETGAGKSILLNSLNLALGERADSNIVRHGESRAEVVATFNIARIPHARKWLQERELDEGDECMLRRTISSEGRSRAFINGQPVPLVELKTLGEFLIDIHSQHAHQSLMKTDTHLRLLDDYAGLSNDKKAVKEYWLSWQGLERKFKKLKDEAEEQAARKQLLEYQHEELSNLALTDGEFEKLDAEFKRFHQSETLLKSTHQALSILEGDEAHPAATSLKSALSEIQALNDESPLLCNAKSLLESALIQTQEAVNDLHGYTQSFEFDEERLRYVEDRLNTIHTLARKHQIPSENLFEHGQSLENELTSLSNSEVELNEIESTVAEKKSAYVQAAKALSAHRKHKAKAFEAEIIEKLGQLAMPGAAFEVVFSDQISASPSGIDSVEYQISLNPGQPQQPLAKVASGGELSRISLAIQVVCAEHSTIPTLVFDEVDVGISGATAEIVGHMLRSVGERGQVICVTHLPQVAALGHQHCVVQKNRGEHSTTTQIQSISPSQRIDEIARMLGGIDITVQTRAHAEEMLRSTTRAH